MPVFASMYFTAPETLRMIPIDVPFAWLNN